MRASGVHGFPDPIPGVDGFQVPVGGILMTAAFHGAQSRCGRLLPGGLPGSGPPPSGQTVAKLDRIARCMRRHGVPQFPDPSARRPALPIPGVREITDFDGAILVFPTTIDLQAPAYRHALAACGAPPLGLRH
jgi:hypothetical protein